MKTSILRNFLFGSLAAHLGSIALRPGISPGLPFSKSRIIIFDYRTLTSPIWQLKSTTMCAKQGITIPCQVCSFRGISNDKSFFLKAQYPGEVLSFSFVWATDRLRLTPDIIKQPRFKLLIIFSFGWIKMHSRNLQSCGRTFSYDVSMKA